MQCANTYVETTSGIADAVAKATDAALGPLVNRFLGIIVDEETLKATVWLISVFLPRYPTSLVRGCAQAALATVDVMSLVTASAPCSLFSTATTARTFMRSGMDRTKSCSMTSRTPWATMVRSSAETRTITATARDRARILEQHSDMMPIRGFTWSQRMRPADVAGCLGFLHPSNFYQLPLD